MQQAQRLPAETSYRQELDFLASIDKGAKPAGWKLSPSMVRRFILGDEYEGQSISQKIFGNDDIVEKAIVTLIGQRGLLLAGEPGTAKSMLSELLAAAISGNSKMTVQGSAGIVEENIRYGWNYALLLKSGPTLEALVSGPLYESMSSGQIMRFEELTRCPTEVQDNLIPVMSDKILHIPEIKDEQQSFLLAKPGFNIIATANLRDRGVNEMSSALKRRFNFLTMKPLANLREQIKLIHSEVNKQLENQKISIQLDTQVTEILATAFKDLRQGMVDGQAIDKPNAILSMAEAIEVGYTASVHAHYFGNNSVTPRDISTQLIGTVIKDDDDDIKRFKSYLKTVSRKRASSEWQNFAENISVGE